MEDLFITAYAYDPDNRVYQGEVKAWADPMSPGSYLMPANATDIKPPNYQSGKVRVFNGNTWVQEDEAESQISASGTPEAAAHDVRKLRNLKLQETDWTQLPDVPLNANQRTQYAIYRQALRDIPQQPEFPTSFNWPEL